MIGVDTKRADRVGWHPWSERIRQPLVLEGASLPSQEAESVALGKVVAGQHDADARVLQHHL